MKKQDNATTNQSEYFKTARSWADDIYSSTLASRNRYKLAFLVSAGLVALLALCIMVMVPLQRTELVIAHEGQGGYVWISTTHDHMKMPATWARTQAEIAHYITTRESYHPNLYHHQTSEVALLSSPDVQAGYEASQASDNAEAPINVLKVKGYRTVQIQNILPLDSASKNTKTNHDHTNIAQVNYTVTDHLFGRAGGVKTPYSAIVSWQYSGVPSSPEGKLEDWDGFQITKYQTQASANASTNSY